MCDFSEEESKTTSGSFLEKLAGVHPGIRSAAIL